MAMQAVNAGLRSDHNASKIQMRTDTDANPIIRRYHPDNILRYCDVRGQIWTHCSIEMCCCCDEIWRAGWRMCSDTETLSFF